MSAPLSFTAHGIPVPQGSARAVYLKNVKRAVLFHDKKDSLVSWRTLVADAAVKAMNGRAIFDDPIQVCATFVLPRPPSIPKKRLHPDRKPDLDKLVRAIGDALTGVVYTDDARICAWHVDKRYGAPAGVTITIGSPE